MVCPNSFRTQAEFWRLDCGGRISILPPSAVVQALSLQQSWQPFRLPADRGPASRPSQRLGGTVASHRRAPLTDGGSIQMRPIVVAAGFVTCKAGWGKVRRTVASAAHGGFAVADAQADEVVEIAVGQALDLQIDGRAFDLEFRAEGQQLAL
jgi:hypothetical protein